MVLLRSRQMIGIGILFCLILVNVISGTNGVGEEVNNGNGKNDLLFGQMWRKAFEANRHNGKEREEKEEMPKKEVKEEQKEEKEDKEEEKEIKLWKKVKKEPIDDKLKVEEEKEERDGKRRPKMIKKELKFEEKEWEDLVSKSETKENDQRQDNNSASDQNDSDQSARQMKAEEKWEIIEKFDNMRKECKKKKGYTNEMRGKIEQEIAKALGVSRINIYKWKKELIHWKESAPESEERKRKIIKEFDRMRNEYKNQNKYHKNYNKIERAIARELGTCRSNIYQWKKALTPSRVTYTKGQKRAIIAKFDDLCEEFSNKFNRKTSKKIEEEIAKKFYVCRMTIYMWKKFGQMWRKAFEANRHNGKEGEEKEMPKEESKNKGKKWKIIKKFDKMRKEYKNKKDYKNEDRHKMEQEIAKALGVSRKKIYKWKKELIHWKESAPESEERKRKIIDKFDRMRKEYKMKKNYKWEDRNKIEQGIAKALDTYREKIYKWKKEFAKSNSPEKRANEQKGQIIELFDKLCEEFANKFNRKAGTQIKDKIARKFGVSGRTIDRWKKKLSKINF